MPIHRIVENAIHKTLIQVWSVILLLCMCGSRHEMKGIGQNLRNATLSNGALYCQSDAPGEPCSDQSCELWLEFIVFT